MHYDLHQCAFANSGKEAGVFTQRLLAQQQSALTDLLDPFVCVADVCSPDGSLCTTGSCPLAGAGNGCNPDGQTHLCLAVFTADLHAGANVSQCDIVITPDSPLSCCLHG